MEHAERFTIIGFLDAVKKKNGTEECTHFRPEDIAHEAHIPTEAELALYAKAHGYNPGGGKNSISGRCQPIYFIHGDGLDYLNCPSCFPRTELTDNRTGPA